MSAQPAPEDYMATWEAMLDMREKLPWLDAAWNLNGTATMRGDCIEITKAANKAWESLTEDEQEEIGAWDWEFLPMFLERIASLTPIMFHTGVPGFTSATFELIKEDCTHFQSDGRGCCRHCGNFHGPEPK